MPDQQAKEVSWGMHEFYMVGRNNDIKPDHSLNEILGLTAKKFFLDISTFTIKDPVGSDEIQRVL